MMAMMPTTRRPRGLYLRTGMASCVASAKTSEANTVVRDVSSGKTVQF